MQRIKKHRPKLQPVVEPQSSNTLKISRVVRDQREIVEDRCGCNQQVGAAYRDSSLQQRSAKLAELDGTIAVEIEHTNIRQQFAFDPINQRLWIVPAICPRVQFSQHDTGNVKPSRVLHKAMSQTGRAFQVGRTSIRVEEIAHSPGSGRVSRLRS